MVAVSIAGDAVVFELEKSHRLWSLRSRLEIPLRHIVAVRSDPGLSMGWFDRLKLAGAYLPGLIAAGTFYEDGGLVFWDVEDPARAVVVELADETYKKLVVEVRDPDGVVGLIRSRLTQPVG